MTEVVTTVVGKVVENLVDQILDLTWNQIACVFKLGSNKKNLLKKVEKLTAERDRMLQSTEVADRRGEEAGLKLKSWLTCADKYVGKMGKLGDEEDKVKKNCFFGVCPNPKVYYQRCKKAEEYLEDVGRLLEEAGKFEIPDFYYPTQKISTFSVKGFEEFDSRKPTLNRIMEALRSSSIDIIGKHGIPGVAKTVLAEEVARQAEETRWFDEIVMASVTKNLE